PVWNLVRRRGVSGFMASSLSLDTLAWHDAMLRVALALFFGFCIGYDRGSKHKPVDFRVYMIVAATTCLLAIMGEEVTYAHRNAGNHVEFGLFQLVQGVLTGIGFLGAGAIIRNGRAQVIGTATGASIWAAGAMGLMLGFGLYGLAALGFCVLVVTLVLFGLL